MATTTTHYGFTKPGVNDYVDISVLNANFDNLDTVIYNNQLSAQAVLDDIAPAYDATATYSVGDYVTYNKTLYRCTTAISTAEAFDDTKWTAVKVGGELKSHDTRISDLEAGVELEGAATNSFDNGIDSYFKKVVSSIVPVQAGSGTPSPTNVRAISGFTECTVLDISDNTNANYFMGLLKGTYDFVDLGSLNWTYQANLERMNCTSTIPNIKTPESNSDAFNGISPKYQSVSAFNIIYNNKCMAVNTTGELRIKDTDYTDATTFKTAMNGVYLIYELATPTTPTITDAQMQTLLTAFGYNGSKATISFGSAGTVYGGYVDLVSGRLVVNIKMFTDNGSMNWRETTTGFVLSVADSGISDCKNASTTNTPIVCNIAERATSVWQDGKIGIDFRTIWIGDTDKSIYTDVEGLKSFLSTNPIQILYPLATPQEYQLTPAQLRSLVGANRLTSSTGEVTEVEYIKNKTIAWLLDLIRA